MLTWSLPEMNPFEVEMRVAANNHLQAEKVERCNAYCTFIKDKYFKYLFRISSND